MRWCAILAFALVQGAVFGDTISIPGPEQLKSLDVAKPGDVVILKNGTWRNACIVVSNGGTAEKPLLIRAETAGKLILSGSSSLRIAAPHVIVDGLSFSKGSLEGGAVIQFNSHHGTVRNTAIIDYNPGAFETGYYWIFFNGDDKLVDQCFFKGKNNLEPLIGNGLADSRRNAVKHSYFKDIPYAKHNGREIFRIWGAGKLDEDDADADGAYFTIEENLFDHADGEGKEIISLKSNHNQVLRNTILSTRGGITIRRGCGLFGAPGYAAISSVLPAGKS